MKLKSINPSNNEVLGEVEITTEQEIKNMVAQAHQAEHSWRDLGVGGRNAILIKFYNLLEQNKQELAELTATEMGMPLEEALFDIDGSVEYLRWYSNHAHESLDPEITHEDDSEISKVYREPWGVVAAIIPWNFPLSNFVWMCGQNLVAGNVVVLKHSEEVPLFSKKLEELSQQAGIPGGVLSFVYGDGKVGDILAHQEIDLLCFTGSTKVGKYLYTVAAEKFIPIVMELGGSAPGIVFEDADFPRVMETIMINRFLNAGQACDGLKRLIVHKSKFNNAVELLTKEIKARKIGPAINKSTTIGPLVAERQVKLLEDQVQDALTKGAKVEVGGKRPTSLTGAYYEPTLLTNVTQDMRIWQEEVFGPVLPIVTFETEEEAIILANDTKYGLGSYVFTEDKERFERVAKQIQAGMSSQNNTSYLKPYNPFGGYKQSGLGREHGEYGFHDVTQVKVITTEK